MPEKNYPKLRTNLSADVVIIGGGLTGVLAAYILSQAGLKVVLLQAEHLAEKSATVHTTAFATQVIDTDLLTLRKLFGPARARLVWESGQMAIQTLEVIVKELECDFTRCPAFIYAATSSQAKILKKNFLLAKELGFKGISWKNASAFPFLCHGGIKVEDQAKFHPLKLVYQLAQRAEKFGAQIFENSKVMRITGNKHLRIYTSQGLVEANQVIVATYQPFSNPKAVKVKKGMYDSYVLELRLPPGRLPEALYWDQNNPYNYWRVDPGTGYDRVLLGGIDHRSEIKIKREKNFTTLLNYWRQLMPGLPFRVIEKWRGPILESIDGLPFIGAYEPNKYMATAFSGNGMTYAAIAAVLFKDLLLGRTNPYTELYSPTRKINLKSLWYKGRDYTSAFFSVAVKNLLFN